MNCRRPPPRFFQTPAAPLKCVFPPPRGCVELLEQQGNNNDDDEEEERFSLFGIGAAGLSLARRRKKEKLEKQPGLLTLFRPSGFVGGTV